MFIRLSCSSTFTQSLFYRPLSAIRPLQGQMSAASQAGPAALCADVNTTVLFPVETSSKRPSRSPPTITEEFFKTFACVGSLQFTAACGVCLKTALCVLSLPRILCIFERGDIFVACVRGCIFLFHVSVVEREADDRIGPGSWPDTGTVSLFCVVELSPAEIQ